MEWQAGYVCGALLMPISALVQEVCVFREEEGAVYDPLVLNSDTGREADRPDRDRVSNL